MPGTPIIAYTRASVIGVAPATILGAMGWAHLSYRDLFAEAYTRKVPTISSTLNEAPISDPFTFAIAVALPFHLLSLWWISRLYLRRIDRAWPGADAARRQAGVMLYAFVALQCLADLGTVFLAAFPSDSFSGPHTLGSYMLFFGHASSIFVHGYLCLRLARAAPEAFGWLRYRWTFAWAVAAGSVAFAALFYARELPGVYSAPGYHLFVAAAEFALIASFGAFLFSFMAEAYRDGVSRSGRAPLHTDP